ncbi:toprim domain-containing protein [Halomonas sp.]|uniref:toprim domain-containing protein n=1 Tax=Halomonas sp. TaxID=1486246 RepID=UPI00257B7575|nr:toprim domain-containing protein [Halomonas sp.]MCJ8287105.1 toprim domain-containing protein [Halomonas sp.]NQY71821.1 toprim domain-containing protein [Halomonas sp.]
MNPSLRQDILARLKRDYRAEERGPYLQKVQCPDCGKREAYIATEAPWMLKCGRENNCGSQLHVKELFPEFFASWSERYAPRPDQPPRETPASATPVADGYLRDGRGFELERIQSWYSQESYWKPKVGGSATVRFTLPGGAYWERLLDNPERFGKQKANFVGRYKGNWWQPPTLTAADLVEAGEVWIVEGIFDAIALYHHGIAAVSAMSCANYPDSALKVLADAAGTARPTLVWALDGNRAGQNATLKHVQRARAAGWECGAAQIPGGGRHDWNDCHQRDELTERHRETYRYHGALLLAPSAMAKALIIYKRTERREFWFEYKRQVWWWKLDVDAFDRAVRAEGEDGGDQQSLNPAIRDAALEQAGNVKRICTCFPTALYYQANAITDESWYYYRVEFPDGRAPVKNTFSGGQLASASEYKKRLLGVAPGAVWTGTSQQLDTLLQDQIGNIKTVETIDYIGYSKEHGAYVFGDLAVAGGKLVRINSEDYFELGPRKQLKTLSQSVTLHLNPDREAYQTGWTNQLLGAFGSKGVVALAYWLGSLLAEQIRAEMGSFPFLEIVGEAGAGKSTLIEFLWKLVGRRDYEGFDPSKATMPARSRNFAQVSNLPVVLIESDREQEGGAKQKQFDWDELKTAFNGRSIRARGVKNSGNDTYEPPFRASIVISQNAAVQAGEAIQTRICHLHFTREGQNRQTKELAEALEKAELEHVSQFALDVAQREAELLTLINERARNYAERLAEDPDVKVLRIAKCHGQLAALVECLGPEGLGLFNTQTIDVAAGHVWQMARERQQAINADHPLVAEFWEAVDYLEGLRAEPVLDHYGGEGDLIAINLKDFERACGEYKLRVPELRELKRYLKASKTRKFVDANRTVRSRIRLNGASVKCWVFQA